MRHLGFDIGERRIGVAVSDPTGSVATPLVVLDARSLTGDLAPLRRLVDDYEPEEFVVGLPFTLAGEEGMQAALVKATVRRLLEPVGIPVTYYDERLSSEEAERAMAAAGLDSRARRGTVDMVAAALLLQSHLDAERAAAAAEAEPLEDESDALAAHAEAEADDVFPPAGEEPEA